MNNLKNNEIISIFKTLSEGVIVHKSDTSIYYFNDSALEILQLSADELLSKTAHDPHWYFIGEDLNKLTVDQFPVMISLNTKQPVKNMVMGVKHYDQIVWLQVNTSFVFDDNENIELVIVTFVNITAQKKALEYAKVKTYYNSLSSLPNILSFKQDRIPKNCFFLLLQIDNFSNLKQYYGEELSNEMLLFVSRKLVSLLKKNQSIYHIEIDKFGIVFESDKDDEELIKQFLISLNETDLFFKKLEFHLQVTAGISYELTDTLLTAQNSLERAKTDHKLFNIYSHNSKLTIEINNEIFWSEALRKIIQDKLIKPAFQPIIDNKTLKVNKYEVLMRVEYENEIYYPNSFLEISKKLKLYKHLTMQLIDKVFDFFSNKNIAFSINLNTEDLMSKTVNKLLLNKITKFHTPSNVTIEIVESEGIDNFAQVNRFLNRLKVYGCQVAIDDFGSGYANFENILKLDADYIKIDGTLIKDIHENQDSKDIVSTIVSFSKLKDIKTIAEFVSEQNVNTINNLGIDLSQGFYFGKPEFTIKNSTKTFTIEPCSLIEKKKYKQLVYASRKAPECTEEEMNKLFEKSKNRNKENGISGFIVYSNNYFLQVLEGYDEKVNSLYENIVSDNRHTDIILLGFKQLSSRDFQEWNLGLVDNDRVIKDYLFKSSGKELFLPFQYDYDFALEFLKNVNKIR